MGVTLSPLQNMMVALFFKQRQCYIPNKELSLQKIKNQSILVQNQLLIAYLVDRGKQNYILNYKLR